MDLQAHAMLPDVSHDEKALQNFVTSFRAHLASRVRSGMRQVYEKRVLPRFQETHHRPPASREEVGREMVRDDYYQFWSAMQRRSQEMMWESVIECIEPQIRTLSERAKRLSAKAKGTLELDPNLQIPRYHTVADIHLQPGGYHTEVTEDDVTSGAVYDNALPIYGNGAGGPRNDLFGRTLVQFFKKNYPDRAPKKILDMGCAIGNSTLAWAEAFPNAEVHGIDVAAPLLRYAHARADSMGFPTHFKQQNAEKTNYPDQSFDLIVSHIIMHETSQRALRRLIAESHRLLAPGGMMLHLDIPCGQDPFDAFMLEWETMNNNENFAGMLRDSDLPALAVEAGFAPANARIELAPRHSEERQKTYADKATSFPILVGVR